MSDYLLTLAVERLERYRTAVRALPDGAPLRTIAGGRMLRDVPTDVIQNARLVAALLEEYLGEPVPVRWHATDAQRVVDKIAEVLLAQAHAELPVFAQAKSLQARRGRSAAAKKTTEALRAKLSPLQHNVESMEKQLGKTATDRAIADAMADRGWNHTPSSVNRARRALRAKGR